MGAMARLSVGESLTNLVWAQVSALEDVRCSGNWMWAAKLPGEGAALHDAAVAMSEMMKGLGIAVDGGKDSISMAAHAPDASGADETVKAPGELVISAYVTCPDITKTVTPDLKLPGEGRLLYVDLGGGAHRLGGSSLAHVYGQIGDASPDVEDVALLKRAFNAVQELVAAEKISAGHDRSDGGLITTILEMAFAGNHGVELELEDESDAGPIPFLFSEELGLVLEVRAADEAEVLETFRRADVPCVAIGTTRADAAVVVRYNDGEVLCDDVRDLRDVWEETSYQLDRLQANPECVEQERSGLRERSGPKFSVPFAPRATPAAILERVNKIPVAILREEGSNGDREMASAFYAAGFEPWDVVMSDLLAGRVDLRRFRGVVGVGGFSYADVLDSAKGWAGVIRFNEGLWQQFEEFYARPDTFSLGICNGCQLLALLGWVPWRGIPDEQQPRFIQNASGRFESRFVALKLQRSPAIMLRGMEGATLGVWVAHGEGRAFFPDESVLERVLEEGLAPVRFVDDEDRVTEVYPHNPNGSPHGIAGLTSPDGRHLVMMPHPERSFLKWQWGWMPEEMRRGLEASPWLRMFQNAREWAESVGGGR
jgi:phosphoribosylformylglycinamidine synthase